MYILDLLQMILFFAKGPLSFSDFSFKSINIPGFKSSDKVLYQITMPSQLDQNQNQMIHALGYRNSLTNLLEAASQLYDEEQESKMDTNKQTAILLKASRNKQTAKLLNKKLVWTITKIIFH